MARPLHTELFAVGSLCIGVHRLHGYDYRPESSLGIQIFRFTLSLLATSSVSFHYRERPMEGNTGIPWV